MDRTERFYKIDQIINERKLVPFKDLQDELEVSRATLKRDLEYMRNRLNAPIIWDRDAGGYGIFTGHDVQYAKLKFTPERARWVAQESWHPKQRGILDPDGSYTLEVPYADDRELLMDILKFGNEVEVQGPASLKKRVKTEIDRMSKRYS